ncbi:MAG: TetR/AcrR family transcriptional regulator [Actinobacteria bacterium]|nr:TetR/AcrR family transcriptional regulator [Actinomycetota bacterium]
MVTTLAPGRQLILDQAATLFVERGFKGTSLRDIAAACEMKAGSLYYHFESKDHLLIEVLTRGIDVMVEAFDAAATTTANSDGSTRLKAHIRAHLAALYENGPYTAVHVTSFRTASSQVRAAVIPERDRYESKWTLLLTDMVDTGQIRGDMALGLTRLTLFGAMNTSIEWFDLDRGNLDELADVLVDQYWNGLAA